MIKKRFSLTRVMASFCFVFLVFTAAAFPGDTLSSEFLSPAGESAEVVPDEKGVIRSRLVEIDPVQLSQLENLEQEGPGSPYLIYLDLFEDVYLEVLVRRVKSNFPGEYYCKVDIENIPRSKAFFEIKEGMFSAYIAFHGHYYLVRPIRERIHKIEEVDRARFKSQLPPSYKGDKTAEPQDKTAVESDQTANLPASERAALIALYNSTDGDGWSHNTGWKTPPLESDGFGAYGTEGTWFGVTVSGGHVTKLDLDYNGLSGTLPTEIGNLPYLDYFDVNDNYNGLIGGIPSQIGNLTLLKFCGLGDDEFSGSIPSTIGNLTQLEYLYLHDNDLSGPIPSTIGNLTKLLHLHMDDNRFSGGIPPEIGNLTSLEYFDANESKISGSLPSTMGNLTSLQHLNLCGNQLSGSIPAQMGNLTSLVYLDLESNQLSGAIPPELGNLSSLQTLYLYYNQLSGAIPAELGNLGNLKYLYLYHNQLSGALPSQLGNLGTLRYLYLQSNKLIGSIPSSLTNLTNLYSMDIGYNGLYTDNETLRTFLNGKDSDWESTQTIAPANVSASSLSASSVRVSWTPIIFTSCTGGYKVYYSTTSGGPWSDAGITANKSTASYDVTGLTTGTTYYFVLKTQTNPHVWNDNTVVSDYSAETSATPNSGGVTYTLTVQSSPDTGASITVSPNDKNGNGNGTTNFTRIYNEGTIVTLTAPGSHNGKNFSKWSVDGSDHTNQTVQVTMNANHALTAIYGGGTATYTLTVQSWPNTGAAVTVSPNDNNGKGNGTTDFTRTYDSGTQVTLTAPGSHQGQNFSKWTVDGVTKTGQSIKVTMNGNHTAKAFYGTMELSHIELNRTRLNYGAIIGGPHTGSQHILIGNSGGNVLAWTASASDNWIQVSPSNGTEDMTTSVSVQVNGLSTGSYQGTVTITDPGADNSPVTVDIYLEVKAKSKEKPVFGSFDTPVHGANVCSSIAVTGWAVDDVEVSNVQIFRNPVPGQETGLIYIGDAVFVEGPRPDVEAAYPGYPKSYKAGWGYMMLTNFLPNGGNGTYVITAVATDSSGNEVTLGTKTIHCDNAHSVKPFGAIDTPSQGGDASGSSFINWGWVLTPQPNDIPANGTTIHVWVDGVNVGQPTYNIYRSDIANLFPGYVNSNGAAGYFYLDTTPYENGVHTIQWTATNSAGNTDGIGSRYFTIMNTGSSASVKSSAAFSLQRAVSKSDLSWAPVDYYEPVEVTTGYKTNDSPQIFYPDENGNITIEIDQMQRLEIRFFGETEAATTGDRSTLNAFLLPIGSTMDKSKGVFYWQPGPAFLGEHRLVFIDKVQDLAVGRKNIIVKIVPQSE
jgi:Leucine-rich repeat (LRR) protein